MPPLTPGTLQHQVDGCQVCCYHVEIKIQTLLGHLSGYENFRAVPASTCTKDFQNHILARLSSVGRESRVKEQHFRPIGKPFPDSLTFVLQRLAPVISNGCKYSTMAWKSQLSMVCTRMVAFAA